MKKKTAPTKSTTIIQANIKDKDYNPRIISSKIISSPNNCIFRVSRDSSKIVKNCAGQDENPITILESSYNIDWIGWNKNGQILFSDFEGKIIRQVSLDGSISVLQSRFRHPDPQYSHEITSNYSMTAAGDGSIYIVIDNCIVKISQLGQNDMTIFAGRCQPDNVMINGQISPFQNLTSILAVSDFNSNLKFLIAFDVEAKVIWRISRDGLETSVHAHLSTMSKPSAVSSDSQGNVFYIDNSENNFYIRRVDVNTSEITTIPSSITLKNPSSISISSDNCLIYVLDDWQVLSIRICSAHQRPAQFSESLSPTNIALDMENNMRVIYVTDSISHVIRKLYLQTNNVEIFSGKVGEHGLVDGSHKVALWNSPYGIAISSERTIYVSDSGNHVIRKISLKNLQVSTISGSGIEGHEDGNKQQAKFCKPKGLSISGSSDIYVADSCNQAIRKISLDQGHVSTLAKVNSSGLSGITSCDNGLTYASDAVESILYRIGEDGNVLEIVGGAVPGFRDGKVDDGRLNHPHQLACDSKGSIFISDSGNHAIRKLSPHVGLLTTIGIPSFSTRKATNNNNTKGIFYPMGVSLLPGNPGVIYVADWSEVQIRIIGSNLQRLGIMASNNLNVILNNTQMSSTTSIYNANSETPLTFTSPWVYGTVAIVSFICFTTGITYLYRNWKNTGKTLPRQRHVISNEHELPKLALAEIPKVAVEDQDTSTLEVPKDNTLNGNEIKVVDMGKKVAPQVQLPAGAQALLGSTAKKKARHASELEIAGGDKLGPLPSSNNVKPKRSVIERLSNVSIRVSKNSSDGSKTLNSSQSVPIAVPGFLEMKIREVIKINDEKDTSVRKGGTGYVVKAEFKTQELIEKHGFSTVAVKFFEKSNIENFRFEVMLMGALPSSPFIVKMLGYCEDPMGIIMKYYPLNLDHLLASPKFCEPADVKIKLASDIAEGMNILHSHDIIHFDLKPGNVLVDVNKDLTFTCAICDFGYANFSSDGQRKFVTGVKRPTNAGITTKYAAPEMFTDVMKAPGRLDNEIHKKIDVYAYAMTLYVIAFGERPWSSTADEEIPFLVLRGQRPSLFQTNTPVLKDIILKAWAPEPTQRPTFKGICEILSDIE